MRLEVFQLETMDDMESAVRSGSLSYIKYKLSRVPHLSVRARTARRSVYVQATLPSRLLQLEPSKAEHLSEDMRYSYNIFSLSY